MWRAARAASRVGGAPGRQTRSHLPQQPAPGEPEAVAPTHPREMLDRGALEPGRRPTRQVADAREQPAPLPLEHELGRRLLTPVPDKPEPHSHDTTLMASPLSRRERGTGGEVHRAPHITRIHIR